MADPDFDKVTVLLSLDGADASTTFTDDSSVARTFTANGNAQLDVAQKVFGTASLLCDGTGDSISTPDAADLNFGSGDFTVEQRVRFASTSGETAFVGQYDTAGNDRSWLFWRNASSGIIFNWSTNGTNFFAANNAWSPSINTDYALAVDRASDILRIYIDGVMVEKNISAGATYNDSAANFVVGDQANGGRAINGWIDELRITKGLARYASDSGYTVATEAFPRAAPAVSSILRSQGARQETFNILHGDDFLTINGDMIKGMLANEPTIAANTFNGIMYEWLGLQGQSEVTLNGRLQGFATANSAFNWSSLGTF